MSSPEENNKILGFYWLKMAKQGDEVVLLYVTKKPTHDKSSCVYTNQFMSQCR